MNELSDVLTETLNEMGEVDRAHKHRGPRNLPKPDARKKRRQEQRAKRKHNRGKNRG
jgi:hypothetical protein